MPGAAKPRATPSEALPVHLEVAAQRRPKRSEPPKRPLLLWGSGQLCWGCLFEAYPYCMPRLNIVAAALNSTGVPPRPVRSTPTHCSGAQAAGPWPSRPQLLPRWLHPATPPAPWATTRLCIRLVPPTASATSSCPRSRATASASPRCSRTTRACRPPPWHCCSCPTGTRTGWGWRSLPRRV